MRFEIEHQQRPQHLRVAHGDRQLQNARMHGAIDEPQFEMDGGSAAIGALERRRQRFEEACQYECQRLEAVDRPLELDALEETRHIRIGNERARVHSACHPLQRVPHLSEP